MVAIMSKYKVMVDRSLCIACGVAPSICSQVFELGNDNGKNRVVEAHSVRTDENVSEGIIPEDLYECAASAVQSCPVGAIKIEKID